MSAMHLTRVRTHAVFPMGDASRVGEARRHAAQLAANAGLDEIESGRLAIIVNELGTNLVKHAVGGQLLIAGDEDGEVEVIATDKGPGIADVPRSLDDGYSTAGTTGTGLGAVRRLAQDFDMHSVRGEGTAIVARVRRAGRPAAVPGQVRVAGVGTCAPGETQCGDSWAAWTDGACATLLVADGLGHGPAAAEAAGEATAVLEALPGAMPREIVQQSHQRLRATRGAALAVLRIDAVAGTVGCCGAGNVITRVVSGVSDRTAITQHGTVGMQMRTPEESFVEWPLHAVVIAHTDGIESRWPAERIVPLLARDPVLLAAVLLRDHSRGRDDATVVVARRQELP